MYRMTKQALAVTLFNTHTQTGRKTNINMGFIPERSMHTIVSRAAMDTFSHTNGVWVGSLYYKNTTV